MQKPVELRKDVCVEVPKPYPVRTVHEKIVEYPVQKIVVKEVEKCVTKLVEVVKEKMKEVCEDKIVEKCTEARRRCESVAPFLSKDRLHTSRSQFQSCAICSAPQVPVKCTVEKVVEVPKPYQCDVLREKVWCDTFGRRPCALGILCLGAW